MGSSTDAINSSYPHDIENQDPGNYNYDAIGNLISDIQGGIVQIDWNVYGKPTYIEMANGDRLTFKYDAAGNRIRKYFISASDEHHTTWYVRDASGNVISSYSATLEGGVPHQQEVSLYGSSRLGVYRRPLNDWNDGPDVSDFAGLNVRHFNRKRYELTDHLGNVRALINDRLNSNIVNNVAPTDICADVLSLDNYYPFGMQMPGRTFDAGAYKYGFNGMEKDDEVKGSGNSYTTHFRQYDPRLGRWMSKDPIFKPHESPYANNGNSPIWLLDPTGSDSIFYDKTGAELTDLRIKSKDDFFFLKHEDGNLDLNGNTFYQGLSRESFFGDRGDGEKLFNEVDERFNQNHEWKFFAIVRDHKIGEHSVGDFIAQSPENQHYDFKNSKYINKRDNPQRAFMVEGMLLNANEVGNILWGAAAASFGFTSFWAQSGAYAFTLKDEGQPDEAGEQRAIEIGVFIWNKFNEQKK